MGTYQITWLQQWHLQQIRNVFYYVATVGEPSDSEWQDIVDEIRADFVTTGSAFWSEDWKFYGIDRRRVDLPGLLSFSEFPTLGEFYGTNVADSVPTQVALLISNKGTTTKPNRARSYMAGMVESQVTNSLWVLAIRSALESHIDYQSDLNGAGANPLQRVAAQWNASHTQVLVTNDLSGAVSKASVVPATQRRRRIGVGI